MDVLVNGEPHRFDRDLLTVLELLGRLDVTQRTGLAVAVNYMVIPKSQWADQHVREGDEVEIVRATQGG